MTRERYRKKDVGAPAYSRARVGSIPETVWRLACVKGSLLERTLERGCGPGPEGDRDADM